MNQQQLQATVAEAAERLAVPGVAIGVYHGGEEHYAFHGITSVENPLPVDENTLFQFGSTGKTFTSTALLRLVEQGLVDLHAPVRTYVPELRLKDEDVARRVTVLQLLNHTAGWEGDLMDNTGDGDDALARFIEKMAEIEQVTPLGAAVSYNNASLSLAGRIIEKVTGQTYEQAIKELIFQPLGLEHSYFFPNEIMTRRFVAGHTQHDDGSITVARPWALPRGGNPAGGISSTIGDQIAWARFHLGDGRAPDGTRILSETLLKQMQQPTAEMPGSALG
ncbi:MAG: beta-lactamase family protein, partial [Chloroflexota bacterium]|nr:beta-lactamase family protein [Chloroflexota bacterium]